MALCIKVNLLEIFLTYLTTTAIPFSGTYRKRNGETINVAIKTLHNTQNDMNREAFRSEAQLMMKLNHHCIVKFIGLSLEQTWCMIQELIPLGSMLNYILTQREKINPNFDFKLWAAQIACGMYEFQFIHTLNYSVFLTN